MAVSDPCPDVPTPTGTLQGIALFSWSGSAWTPTGVPAPSVATPTGVLRGCAGFSWDGSAWQPAGRALPSVPTPTGTLDGVALHTWNGSSWQPAGANVGKPSVPTPSGTLEGVAVFNFDGTAWQPAGQAAPEIATPWGVLKGVAAFSWSGTAWAAFPAPSLDLQFTSMSVLDPRVTFARASIATYFDVTGTLQTAASGAPRLDYDPVAHAPRGLLIEESRVNLLFPSGDCTTLLTVSNSLLTAASGAAPDGTNTMARMSETAAAGVQHFATKSALTVTASATYTFSVFAQAQQDQWLQLIYDDNTNGCFATFDLVAGTVSQANAPRGTGTATGAAIQRISGNIYRCSIIGIAGASTTARVGLVLCNSATPGFAPAFNGTAANGLLVWGAQLEAGAFPTSYIPTVGASVTRAADAASVAMARPTPGTLAVDGYTPALQSKAATVCGFNNGPGAKTALNLNGGNNVTMFDTAGLNVSTGNEPAGANWKAAYAFNNGAQAGCLNGGAVVTGSLATLTAGEVQLGIGYDGSGQQPNLNFRRVRVWPQALTNAQLQQVTT